MARHLIVVDLETTGLHDEAAPLEVALLNVDTGESMTFVPHVTYGQMEQAQQIALEVNGYFERKLWRDMLTEQQTAVAWSEVQDWLRGNTFAGSNPAFDSAIVARQLVSHGATPAETVGRVWHHRLADLAAYAAGKLDVDPAALQGLDDVAERLAVPVAARHTAIGDVLATGLCFDLLRATPAAAL
ncbi:DnaE-like DNA polymerase III [Mycobacterium phage KiSi]|uniref:DnaE-like DNA polymerase III n=1 Tax=Mycobacterium phage KiSi TaxID=2507856 RepID=A0A410TBN0_9CAUD|nr:DNA polymerase exonuclease subunit [Mycobacterium phage KiSi]AYR01228.1 DnaE-like DNA polymerase III [Mycobacterium phage Oscar]QAU06479.1 DnaE-like DNA polymerase III [Mycobacterium phage KiSi]